MKVTRTGRGRPLLLVHGLGSTSQVWSPIVDVLAGEREVVTVDLPGHNKVAAQSDSGTFLGLARSLESVIEAERLSGCDMVGSSLGGQLVLEMARRGRSAATVALDPGGFWRGWERGVLRQSLKAAYWTARGLKDGIGFYAHNPAARTMMLGLLSSQPWRLDGSLVAGEIVAFAETETLDQLIDDLAFGPPQEGPAAPRTGPVTIGWGRHDRLCNPSQAVRALEAFPDAQLHWFEESGHFPMWDEPAAAARLILERTGGQMRH